MGPLSDSARACAALASGAGGGTLVKEPPARPRRGGGGAPGGTQDGDGDGSKDGDGGWGGGPGDGDAPQGGEGERAEFGLRLVLVGITSLFLIFLAAYVRMRRVSEVWPPEGAPGAPLGLWVSTLLLAASSLTMSRAHAAATRGERGIARTLAATLALGAAFLAVQAAIWVRLAGAGLLPSTNGYGSIFYALTGLHGIHVLVGLAYLGLLVARARRGRVRARQVRLCSVYWHYMAFVWLVIFCLLWVPGGAAS